jgi:ATP-dependent Clp protease ATP-binding subunit ClpC
METIMLERFSEGARRVLFFARYELGAHGGRTIEPEHILLGLLRESKGLLGRLLVDSNVPLMELRQEIEQHAERDGRFPTSVEVPFADAAKRLLYLAAEEADRLLHPSIEPPHLLLALLRDNDPIAGSAIKAHGMTLDGARAYLAARTAKTSSGSPSWCGTSRKQSGTALTLAMSLDGLMTS